MSNNKHKAFLRYGEDIKRINDLFSASWIMNVENFRRIETDEIRIIEDACFQPFRQAGSDVRMTSDWLNFAVEHMSQWWKAIHIFHHKKVFDAYMNTLNNFGQESISKAEEQGLKDTIAIIPFMAYRSGKRDGSGQTLTVAMLNATLRSLSRYGMERAVVAVPNQQDLERYRPQVPQKIGAMVVVLRVVNEVKTQYIDVNMPYASVVALQKAFVSDEDDWLGDNPNWQAVYLTEIDTILHIKPNFIPEILDGAINKGWIISPHRLQPIPHASDFPQGQPRVHLVPDNQHHPVQWIDSYQVDCLDCGDHRPQSEPCRTFWYLCGFLDGNHSRLLPYKLMRLSNGLGITMLMGSEHGRQCRVRNK